MKSLLASVLTSRTTRVAALFLSVSAVALGGFFISQAQADVLSITNLHPNGGEFVRGTYNITWTALASSTDTVSIALSTDGGTNYDKSITSANAVGGTYAWDTTHTAAGVLQDGNNYRIQVSNSSTGLAHSSNNFTVDNTPPSTTLASSSPAANGWYNISTNAPSITLSCADPVVNNVSSGCSEIDYAWYDATTHAVVVASTTVAATPIVAPQGDNILVYSSQDNAVDNQGVHNIEAAHSAEFKVDTVAPTISSYTLNGAAANAYFNPTTGTSTTIALTASEPVDWGTVRIESHSTSSTYRDFHPSLDGQATTTVVWNGKIPSGGSIAADGAYDLYYTITDVAGNMVSLARPLTPHQIIVDTTPPGITLTSPVADMVYKSTSTGSNTTASTTALSFTSSDANPLTYTYSINGKATTTPLAAHNDGTTALTSAISGLSDGRHTIVVTVIDGAGNSVSSAPVSFVFDNDNTLTVSGNSADNADFATIGTAISAATAGDTIDIFPGTYTEDVNVNKSLTLQNHSAVVADTTIHGLMTVTSDNTTVKNLSFTNPDASTALAIIGANTVSVTGNVFDIIGTTLTSGSAQAIDVNGGSNPAMSGITVSGNTITNVGNISLLHANPAGSAKGIYIGDSVGVNTISGVVIDKNSISRVYASTADWIGSKGGYGGGAGAYGILVNHATSGAGSTGVTITDNTITTLEGLWAHAIGLEGNTPGATVTGNIISGLTDHKGGTDDVGVMLQDNTGAGSVNIKSNQFAQDIIGVGNDTADLTATTTATGNWWGSNEGPRTTPGLSNPHGAGAWIYGPISFVPWCTDATCSPLDSSAPTAVLTGTPAPITNVTTTDIAVGPAGDVAYYEYKLDSETSYGPETPISTAIASSSLADGSHTLNVIGRDQAGNWQTVPTIYSWTIDTVKPALKEVTPVATPTATTTPLYVFNTTKPGNFTYGGGCSSLTTSATTTGDVAITFNHFSDGVYNCTITVTDSAGNVSNTLDVTPFTIDTTAPAVDAGGDKYVNAEVVQHATATDTNGSGVATYSWSQMSGPGTITFSSGNAADTTISANTDGIYKLRLTVTDNAGNAGYGEMQFTWDTTKPVVTAPADITTEATANMTPLTLTPATATDNITAPADITITSDAPATLPVGTTTVTWTATDKAGNVGTATQQVAITDKTAPTIAHHDDVTAEATSADGAAVTYDLPVATDIVDGTDTVTCAPASGTTFALGDTTVKCDATDKAGNAAAETSFTVTVKDTTAPVIAAHDDMTVTADQLGGNKVTYTVNSTDAVDGPVLADCAPASGSLFPVNETTTVTCNQTDAHGNVAIPKTFTVTVNPDALTTIAVSASLTSLTTADTSTITVAGQDQWGNTVASDNSTIALLSTDNGGSLAKSLLTLVNGATTTTLSNSTAGVVNVNAASNGLIPTTVAVTFTGATAPVITNVQSTNIGTSTVQITWTTDELATSQVEYGTTSGYGSSSAADATLTASHSMTLTGLMPNTEYHFRVKSTDAANNLATSGDNTFTTTIDDSTVTNIIVNGQPDMLRSSVISGGGFDAGWKWVFHVTVPTTETQFSMKFSDFTNGASGTIPAAGNMRFYSAQSSNASASTSAMMITSNDYSDPITLSAADLNPSAAGRQIDVTVEMAVPTGTPSGSYSASYGVKSSSPVL
ncbi:MAG: beta strand repeat-containing protein [Minisyncoccota bacterium]